MSNSGNKRVENKLAGRDKKGPAALLMNPKTILAMVLIGIFSFAALMTLSGYAGDLRKKSSGDAHALSRSAIGYNGIVKLLGEMGYEIGMRRRARGDGNGDEIYNYYDDQTLRIYTMTRPYQSQEFEDLDTDMPALIILPKWNVIPHSTRKGWVQHNPFQDVFSPLTHENVLEEFLGEIDIEIEAKREDKSVKFLIEGGESVGNNTFEAEIQRLQTINGENLNVIYSTPLGPVLVKLDDSSVYILSEPDLMNTHGIAQRPNADFAVNLLNSVIGLENLAAKELHFDLSLHGFTTSNNIIKTMTRPPFLGALLCLLAAGALISWQGFTRFGDPKRTERDYALGKLSLVDNAARFIRIAKRETRMSSNYADAIRELVIAELGLKNRKPKDIETMLRRREQSLKVTRDWQHLKTRAADDDIDVIGLMNLGQDLKLWKREMTHEHR